MASRDLPRPGEARRERGAAPRQERVLRGPGESTRPVSPRRAICCDCAGTHVLLPVSALLRRADVVEVKQTDTKKKLG